MASIVKITDVITLATTRTADPLPQGLSASSDSRLNDLPASREKEFRMAEKEDMQAPWRFLAGFVVGIVCGAITTFVGGWLLSGNASLQNLVCTSLTLGLIFGVVFLQTPQLFGYD